MKERPILFSGPMVRAILGGRKTQTRRIVKPEPVGHIEPIFSWANGIMQCAFGPQDRKKDGSIFWRNVPYGQPGDRLWVKETWQARTEFDAAKADDLPQEMRERINYPANGNIWYSRLRPSTHMPRWASRIILEVTGVRVERLQDISEEDLKAEGIREGTGDFAGCFSCGTALSGTTARECYSRLWAGSWEKNPWVWTIDFRVISQ